MKSTKYIWAPTEKEIQLIKLWAIKIERFILTNII